MLTFKNIVLMVLIFFIFLVLSILIKITKEQQEELNELDKKNTKESFKNSHLMNLCSTKNGDPRKADDLQKRCKHLNKSQCALADCCSYVKFKNETEEQCVASRKGEPIFRKSKQNNPIAYYHYKNKKYLE